MQSIYQTLHRRFGVIALYFILDDFREEGIESSSRGEKRGCGLPQRNRPMTLLIKNRRRGAQGRAFSLIEVILALGVVSFAMTGLLGLLPMGLDISRQAIDVTVESQMAQTLRNQIQLAGLPNVEQWSGQQLYFDVQGLSISNANSPGRVYTAQMTVTNVLEQDKTATSSALSTNVAQMVLVTVTSTAAAQTTNVFPIIVTKNGS